MVAEPGSYRPLAPSTLYLARKEWQGAIATRPIHLATTFPERGSDKVIDFAVEGPRDFAPERAQNANVYDAVVEHIEMADHRLEVRPVAGGGDDRVRPSQ